LHDGRAPAWLFTRMTQLARALVLAMREDGIPIPWTAAPTMRRSTISRTRCDAPASETSSPSTPFVGSMRPPVRRRARPS